MIPANRTSIVHGVERRHLVHPHWRHLQYPRHLIHDTDTREPMLPLSQVQQGHHRRLLILAGVPAEHLLDKLLVVGIEFEGNVRVVDWGISMLGSFSTMTHWSMSKGSTHDILHSVNRSAGKR